MKAKLENFFSRYHPQYIRSLVYMMQASEYRARDFLRWFLRTRDFLRVEQRKKLVKTTKAVVFLAFGYLFLFVLYMFALLSLYIGAPWVFLVFLLGAPFVVAYGMVAFQLFFLIAQRPIEYVIVSSAKNKLRTHTGFKIAIAGSYGKTSMREILKTVLASKKVSAPPGSYNTPLGTSSFIRNLKGDEEVLIFELGEYYPGDIKRLCDLVQPDMGIITGVNEAHLEKFKEISKTQKTIFELADYLSLSSSPHFLRGSDESSRRGGGGSVLYINGENKLAKEYATSLIPPFLKEVPDRAEDLNPSSPCPPFVSRRGRLATPFRKGRINFYTRSGTGKWKVEHVETNLQGTTLTLTNGTQKIQARSHLLGLHQVGPLVVATDIATRLGLSPAHIEKGISETKPFAHRLEPRIDAHGVITLDDSYNGNPDGVRAVIEFLSSLKGYRRFYVTPGLVEMGSKKEEIHQEIGRELARAGIEKVILIRNSVTPFIEKGLQKGKYAGEVIWFPKALDAFSALPNLTVAGDVVLLQNDWPDQYA